MRQEIEVREAGACPGFPGLGLTSETCLALGLPRGITITCHPVNHAVHDHALHFKLIHIREKKMGT